MKSIGYPRQLIFIRHAESERNRAKQGRLYFADDKARKTVRGVPDDKTSITDSGILHARKTGIYLHERFGVPDRAYHSGYLRTVQTLDEAFGVFSESERSKIDIQMNPFIRERDPGYTYDMTDSEVEQNFPWLHEHIETFGGFFYRPPGGESLADVVNRVNVFLNTTLQDVGGKKVWVSIHGGTLGAVRFLLEGWSYDRVRNWPVGEKPENCSITVYNFDEVEKRLTLQECNTVVE